MKPTLKTLALALILPISGASGYALWKTTTARGARAEARRVLFYQDSMHPWVKSSEPGKCTICAMDLTPIHEESQAFEAGEGVVVLNSNSVTVLNVQTEEVRRLPLKRTLRVAGRLELDESAKRIVSAIKPGRIDRLAVPQAGLEVAEGQRLADFFAPELLTEERRYLNVVRPGARLNQATLSDPSFGALALAVQNLRLYGLSDAQIDELSRTGNASASFAVMSPIKGTVIERNVSEGQYVGEGTRLFAIADLSVLWFRFDVYEQDLAWVKKGQKVEVTVPAVPGKSFFAPITFVEPSGSESTRAVKVRADLPNPLVERNGVMERELRYQLFADGRLQAEVPSLMVVPRQAVLSPGKGSYLYVEKAAGTYEMRRVKLGRQGDRDWEVIEGLEEGERVVASGNVLIDAQAQFNRIDDLAADELDLPAPPPADKPTANSPFELSSATGKVEPTPAQEKALKDFLAVADAIGGALADDSLEQTRRHADDLPAVVPTLLGAFGQDHPWHSAVRALERFARWPEAGDLADARRSFLPFSTNVVALVQLARAQGGDSRSLKVYRCPMAPKPGLWFQAAGPLRNPYFGADMLSCGTEVKAPAARATVAHAPAVEAPATQASVTQPAVAPETATDTVAPQASDLETKPQPVRDLLSRQRRQPSALRTLDSRDHSAYEERIKDAFAARFANRAAAPDPAGQK